MTAACALGALRPPLCAGCTRRCRCGAPSARRAAAEPEPEREAGAARAEGGAAQAGRRRAPHLLVGTRPLTARLGPPRALALGFGVSANPQLSLPLPLGTQARPPRPMTSADPGRGSRKAAGRTDTRTAGPPRARRPRASDWRRAHALPLLYTAPRRHAAPPTSGPAGQSPARGGASGPRGWARGRHKGAAAARGAGWRAGARGARWRRRAASPRRAGRQPPPSVAGCPAPAPPGAPQTPATPATASCSSLSGATSASPPRPTLPRP